VKAISIAINTLIGCVAVGFLTASASIILFEGIRNEQTTFPHLLIAAGCELNNYAIPILVSTFVFFAVAVLLRTMKTPVTSVTGVEAPRWKRVFRDNATLTPAELLVSSSGRMALVLFFVGQLSYLFSYCR